MIIRNISDTMVSKKEEEKIDEHIKYFELERKILFTVLSSELEQIEDDICKLGFKKIFESEGTKWFLYNDTKYILGLDNDLKLYIYEKGLELYLNKK